MTRWGVLLAATIVLLMWALLSVRPAYPAAQVTAVDPCPILAVQLESGYVQMLNCSKFFPYLEVRR